jgi:hypothetical protein
MPNAFAMGYSIKLFSTIPEIKEKSPMKLRKCAHLKKSNRGFFDQTFFLKVCHDKRKTQKGELYPYKVSERGKEKREYSSLPLLQKLILPCPFFIYLS